jgi:hypothetical protein
LQCRHEGTDLSPCDWIILNERQDHANTPHPLWLLRKRAQRPRRRRAAQ